MYLGNTIVKRKKYVKDKRQEKRTCITSCDSESVGSSHTAAPTLSTTNDTIVF